MIESDTEKVSSREDNTTEAKVRDSTPKKLLRKFINEAAHFYKVGIIENEDIKPIDLAATML